MAYIKDNAEPVKPLLQTNKSRANTRVFRRSGVRLLALARPPWHPLGVLRYGHRGARQDTTQGAVVAALRSLPGCTVEVIGRPLDLLVGWRGVTVLAEVKQPPGPRGGTSDLGQRLRPSQRAFVERWRGAPPLVLTVDNCIEKITAEVDRQLGFTASCARKRA